MILIGSSAIKHWFEDFPREPKDIDYAIGDDVDVDRLPKYQGDKRIEYLKNQALIEEKSGTIASIDELYTMKISHLFWDIDWDKHMFDVQFLMKKGGTLNHSLFNKLYIQWNKVHGENHRSDLDMTAEEFFDNAMKTYDHDYLHTIINTSPTYKKVLKDGKDVDVSEEKFRELSYEDQLKLVQEEVMVMAYERLAGRDYRVAYSWMLKKFIRNHAPMWEALFIIDNFRTLLRVPFNYKNILDHELSRTNR